MTSFLGPGQELYQIHYGSVEYNQMFDYTVEAMQIEGKMNGRDWPDVLYEKIQVLKLRYLPALEEMYQKICEQQIDSLPQQPKLKDKLKKLDIILDDIIAFLQLPKNNSLTLADVKTFVNYDIWMMLFIKTNRPLEPLSWVLPFVWISNSSLYKLPPPTHPAEFGEEMEVQKLEDELNRLKDEVKYISKKNSEIEGKARELKRKLLDSESHVEKLLAELKEKDELLEQLRGSRKNPRGAAIET